MSTIIWKSTPVFPRDSVHRKAIQEVQKVVSFDKIGRKSIKGILAFSRIEKKKKQFLENIASYALDGRAHWLHNFSLFV